MIHQKYNVRSNCRKVYDIKVRKQNDYLWYYGCVVNTKFNEAMRQKYNIRSDYKKLYDMRKQNNYIECYYYKIDNKLIKEYDKVMSDRIINLELQKQYIFLKYEIIRRLNE